jgi:hypothetical protein
MEEICGEIGKSPGPGRDEGVFAQNGEMFLGLEGRGKPGHFPREFLGVVDLTDLRVPSIENASL